MKPPVTPGDVLAGKFRVERVLGSGGMGIVVAAQHLELDQLVALKFLREEVVGDPTATERFLREARAAARLKNEHIGRVLDFGRLDNGAPYIVMEYLDGQDLSQWVEQNGPMSPAEAAEYVLQACEAMAEAHAAGIIHRDLKPQNLFLTMRQDGRPMIKVLDFGISKVSFAAGHTSTQSIIGTPLYMAPEQMRSSRDVDPRCDIWSLGVILYQMVSAALPFHADTMPELIVKVLQDEPPPLGSLRPGIPPGFARVVHRCLEKDRGRRFANVAELAAALTTFAPTRARAALALISRVLKVAVPVPEVEAEPEPAPIGPPLTRPVTVATAGAVTTLGSSIGQVAATLAPPATPGPRRGWIVGGTALAAVVAVVVIAIGVTSGNASEDGEDGDPTSVAADPTPDMPFQ